MPNSISQYMYDRYSCPLLPGGHWSKARHPQDRQHLLRPLHLSTLLHQYETLPQIRRFRSRHSSNLKCRRESETTAKKAKAQSQTHQQLPRQSQQTMSFNASQLHLKAKISNASDEARTANHLSSSHMAPEEVCRMQQPRTSQTASPKYHQLSHSKET